MVNKPYDNKEKIRFLLTPNYKDTHATTLIHILNPDTKQPIISLFLNSFSNKKYFEYIEERFNLYKERAIYGTYRYEFEEKIPMELKNKVNELWIDEQNKTAVLINPTSKASKNKELLRLKENKTIERSFDYSNGDRPYFHIETIPLIDVSHHLQTEKGDENCVLYGMNFIQAINKMLSDKQYAKTIYDLALQIKAGNVEAENSIKQIFQNDLKAYLLCYYDEKNKEPKSKEEIKNYHLKQRWEIGNQVLDILYPIEKTEDSINNGLKIF
ncbi:MAG: hypothetical protein HYX60_06935 [Legionella longbeachae]|nr:hypothetical protein [Legionella longbeachae]